MRKISVSQILIFTIFFVFVMISAFQTSFIVESLFDFGIYRPILTIGFFILFSIIYSIGMYRFSLQLFPLPIGEIELHSNAEFSYHIHLLFFLVFFHPIIRSEILPLPLMKLVYLGLGAKMGSNTFSGGMILDPIFVELGNNTLVGQGAIIVPHIIENERLAHYPIKIGNNVTIGTGSRILAGAIIEDGSIVSANAVLVKGTHVRSKEIWGGVPAKKIGTKDHLEAVLI